MTATGRHNMHVLWPILVLALRGVYASADNAQNGYEGAALRATTIAARQAEGRDDSRFHVGRHAGVLHFSASDGLEGTADDFGLALSAPGLGGRLETLGIHCDGRELLGTASAPEVDAIFPTRVFRKFGGAVTEWYVNGPLGIEHGYDIDPTACTGILSVELATPGFTPSLRGRDVRLVAPGDAAALRYGELFAADRTGRALPSWFEVTSNGVAIHVDLVLAQGPIVIDPLLYAEQTSGVGSDSVADDNFGAAVSISGQTAVVGAYLADVGGSANQGAAYVFVRSGGVWSQQAKLIAGDGAANDQFGSSVAIHGDTILVGANFDDIASTDQGSAYVFTRSGTSWTQQAKLIAGDGAGGDGFGRAVSVDLDTAVVGAPFDTNGGGAGAGSAYVFVRSGTTWSQQTGPIVASDAGAFDNFGWSVALYGNTAVVGAIGDDVGGNVDQGSAYVITRSGTIWTQQAKLVASDPAAGDQLGYSVSLHLDTTLVGAVGDDFGGSNNQGSAYVFTRSGTTWAQQAKLAAGDGAAGDFFGQSVCVYGDLAMAGAIGDDLGSSVDQGSAYVFQRSGIAWSQQTKILASDGAANHLAGWAVAITDSATAIGAPAAGGTGKVYLGRIDSDSDGDGIPDTSDNCPLVSNASQINTDGDALGDACDTDDDNDGKLDGGDSCPVGDTGWTSNGATDRDSDGCRDAGEDTDDDNDGRSDGSDSCPAGDLGWTSNGSTDRDGDGCRDAGEDTDDDNDGRSDGSDSCPAGDLGWTSNSGTDYDSDGCRDAGEDTDDDNDTVLDGSDNCPLVPNVSQTNTDGDAQGDACDVDDDNDGRADGVDSCPAGNIGWTSNGATDRDSDGCRDAGEDTDDDNDGRSDGSDSCPAGDLGWTSNGSTDRDSDGCRDAGEDTDDDNDGRADGVDSCPAGDIGWTSNGSTDRDSDGCRDAGEDTDDDNDSRSDGSDSCPAGDLGWTSNSGTDNDSDGCRDAGEDTDDDNDTVLDGSDNCPLVPNVSQTNTDGDAQGDACDVDDDNDGRADGVDSCPAGNIGWTSNGATDRDSDGCRDAGEDTDDDNDGRSDGSDSCPAGDLGWTSNGSTDRDSDGCRDAGEDTDDDNDGRSDGSDSCPAGDLGWTSNGGTDNDSDGCRDAGEDTDDDNDAVPDGSDCAPLDSTASAPPTELSGVRVTRGSTTHVAWTAVAGNRYDLAGGTLAGMRGAGNVSDAACLANDQPSAAWDDVRPDPAAGAGYYYLVRGQNACGSGTYGNGASGERLPGTQCP